MQRKHWKILLVIVVLAIICCGIWAILSQESRPAEPYYGKDIVKTGVITCLPHKDKTGPQTLECVLGLRAQSGEYFGIKTTPNSPQIFSFGSGTKIRISGTLEAPVENGRYDVLGQIDVTSIEEVSPGEVSTEHPDWITATTSVIGGGEIVMKHPGSFGVLTDGAPIPQEFMSYIPGCGSARNNSIMCLYYRGSDYDGTNFGSASVGVSLDADASDEKICLTTPELAFGSSSQQVLGGKTVLVYHSGEGATGHQAADMIYQTWRDGKCLKIDARITSSTFEMYESGTIKEFTDEMRRNLRSKLRDIVETFRYASSSNALPPTGPKH